MIDGIMTEEIELASREVCTVIKKACGLIEGKTLTPREQKKLEQHRNACRRWRAKAKQALMILNQK